MSTLNVTSIKGRAGATPSLPDGAVISGINTIDASGIKVGNGIVLSSGGALTATTGTFNGNVSATAFAGSGANLTNLPAQSPVITGIASGTIPANRALCVHSDGKVGLITGSNYAWTALAEVGSSTGTIANTGHMAYGGGKVFMICKSSGNAGVCVAGIVNADRTITWGAFTQFESNISSRTAVVYLANEDKFGMAYFRNGALKSRVATVTGTSISYSTETEIESSVPESLDLAYDPDTNQMIVAYKLSNNNTYAELGTVSGSGAFSFGSAHQITGNNSNGPIGVCYDTKNNKAIFAIGYNGDQSNNGWVYTGDISGTSISTTSAGFINYNYQHSYIDLLYDEERERIVFAAFNANDKQWESLVGKYVSASSITWGGVNIIEQFTNNTGSYNSLAYDPYSKTYGFIYNNTANDSVKYVRGTINPVGSSEPERMTWQVNDAVVLSTDGFYVTVMSTNAGDNIVLAHGEGNNYTVKARIDGARNSTLASDGDNYIGYSAAAYTNGQTVTIQVVGNISTQVGLTPGLKYYIQGDGGITSLIEPNIPSYTVAGIALDATKLLIK